MIDPHTYTQTRSLSQLPEALEVLETRRRTKIFYFQKYYLIEWNDRQAIIVTVYGNVQDVHFGELKWKLQPWNWQILKSGAKFAAAM